VSEDAQAQPLVSVVAPIHNESELLPEFHRRLGETLAGIGARSEVVYVDDGSTDSSASFIESRVAVEDGVVLVQLSRNFGMDVAMSAGLDNAQGRYVVLIHADLQDPPELIPQMLALADEQGADVVFTRRIGRDEGFVKRALATAFYAAMNRLADMPYQGQAGDFKLLSRRVVETIREMPERRRFLRGLVAWAGFKQVPIDYRRAGRVGGRGASYPELFRLALEAIASFSDVPLNLAAYVGVLTALVSAVAGIALLILTGVGVVATTGAHIWILVSVLFLGGLQLIGLGILGRYLARVHEESLRRPLYVVARVERSGKAPRPDSGGAALAEGPAYPGHPGD
jgi:glycosyltransferase involved in cell wall biosynthesis